MMQKKFKKGDHQLIGHFPDSLNPDKILFRLEPVPEGRCGDLAHKGSPY